MNGGKRLVPQKVCNDALLSVETNDFEEYDAFQVQ
jgi:hypothetical protein